MMGIPARSMILCGVSHGSMGSDVLKYTRDTSLCKPLCIGALAPVGHKVQLKQK
jgi:hypothetical protein